MQLERQGAFNRFKTTKKMDEGEMDVKVQQLKHAMDEREKEPFLKIENATCVLSEDEAKELSIYLMKKEIDDLIRKKFPSIKIGLSIQKNLIKISEMGYKPQIPHRIVCCMQCGIAKDFYPIKLIEFWELQEKYHCEKCEKTLQPKERQITL